jgi:phosphoribosylglycinamide formyltransferase 2
MSSSGKGQSKLDGAADVETAWDYAASGGRVDTGRVIVEGFIDFDYEITLLTVRAVGASGQSKRSSASRSATCRCRATTSNRGSRPAWRRWRWSARATSRKVTDDLGGLGLFGVELFVKDDMVWFSEVSPRPHDTGMVTMASQVQSEFELHAKAILGLPVNVALRSPGASAVIYGQLEAKGIAFEGVADALSVPGATCACSASRNRSPAAAWAWRWPRPTISTRRARALAASKVRPVAK